MDDVVDAVPLSINGLPYSNGSSCSDWSSLPVELWVEILCGLQDKELVRCKAVCKLWNDWIINFCVPIKYASAPLSGFIFLKVTEGNSEPFIEYKLYPKSLSDYFGDEACNSYSALLPFKPVWAEFLGCCNGLLLFIQPSIRQYYVSNPATKQFVAIPIFSEGVSFEFASLAFDPCRSLQFKVVCFNLTLPFICCIFSSDTCRWDVYKIPFDYTLGDHCWVNRSVYLGGVLFYLSESMHLICLEVDQINICAIDLPKFDGVDPAGCIGVSRGHLYYSNHDCNNILVWQLENIFERGKWILMHTICMSKLSRSSLTGDLWDVNKRRFFMPYAFHPTSDMIFFGKPCSMLSYHLDTYKLRSPLEMWSGEYLWDGHRNIWPYRRSLINLKSFDQGHCGSSLLNGEACSTAHSAHLSTSTHNATSVENEDVHMVASSLATTNKLSPTNIFWRKPKEGFQKINFAASRFSNGCAAGGFVIRDKSGSVLSFGSRNFGQCCTSSPEALLLVLRDALIQAKKAGYSNIIIEGENLSVINCIRGFSSWNIPWKMGMVISGITLLLRYFNVVKALHCYREGNQVAYYLAKFGQYLDPSHSPCSFIVPDRELYLLLWKDSLGWSCNRKLC